MVASTVKTMTDANRGGFRFPTRELLRHDNHICDMVLLPTGDFLNYTVNDHPTAIFQDLVRGVRNHDE